MRDWKAYVRSQLARPALRELRDERIVEELAGQIEDLFRAHLAHGIPEEEAERLAAEHVEDWDDLARRIASVERKNRESPATEWVEDRAHRLASRGAVGAAGAELIQNLWYALRVLRRRPGFAATVLVILAVGIGCTTALFGVFRTVFLTPLPLPQSHQLTFVMEQASFGCCGPASGPDYTDWVDRQRTFSGMGIIAVGTATLTGEGEAERVYAASASASVFDLLGIAPLFGRTFTANEQAEPSVVLLSYGLWQRRFGGRREVLGKSMEINGAPYTIIGVMPRTFDIPSPWLGTQHHQLYMPFTSAWLEGSRGSHSYPVIARLVEGATLAAAQSDMDRIMRELAQEYPATNADRTVRVFSAHDYMFGKVGRELGFILGAAGLVLLIACGNVASLQLARAAGRETELAVRAALGASRSTLMRLLFSESAVLAALGGLGGVLVSFIAVRAFRAALPPTMPRIAETHVDGWALWFAVGVSAFTALAFGIIPSVIGSMGDLAGDLREGGYGTRAPHKERVRDYFIVAQIALGLVLANGAALLVQSYVRLRKQAPGFTAEGVLTMSINPSGARYRDAETLSRYYDQVLEQVRALPGVLSVGTVSRLPLDGGQNGNVWVEGRPPRRGADEGPLVEVTSVTGDYFTAMGIGLVRGRTLQPADSTSNAVKVVINRHFAQEAWPGEDPLGKRFTFNDTLPDWTTVVGVVDDVRQRAPERPPVSQAYYPLTQGWSGSGYVVVRTQGDPASLGQPVRRAIIAVDPTQAPSDVQTMTTRVANAFAERRFYTTLIGLFAVAALLLAGAGVYGTVSYYVTRRTRELGIRIALGAAAAGIMGLVVRRGVRLAAWGVALGLVSVRLSTSLVEKLLYGIAPLDAWTIAVGCVVLAGVAAAASALPARRALSVPPVLALRAE